MTSAPWWAGPEDVWSEDYNLELANKIIGLWLDSDDIAIALDLMGWKIVPINDDGHPWPMFTSHPLNPPWAEDAKRRATDCTANENGDLKERGPRSLP
jgi:hypothetical protein